MMKTDAVGTSHQHATKRSPGGRDEPSGLCQLPASVGRADRKRLDFELSHESSASRNTRFIAWISLGQKTFYLDVLR